MADFQNDEVSASVDQTNPARGNTELDDRHVGSEESSFTKHSDPSMDPLNPFSTHASMGNNHSGDREETLTHYHEESHVVRSAEPGEVGYRHDDPGDFMHEETRNKIFLDSDQSGDGPFSSHIGRGDEAGEIVKENIDSNPFSMEVENPNVTASSSHCEGVNRPGVGYNPFLSDEQEVEMDEEDDRTDDSQEQSDGFPDPGLNGSLGSIGRGDERGVNHTYNLLEEDEEEEEVDIQMEPVENIEYAHDDEDDRRAPVGDEPQVLHDYRLVGNVEDFSQGSATRYVEDLSDISAEQHGRVVSERQENMLEVSSKGENKDGFQQGSAEHADVKFQDSLMADGEEISPTAVAGHAEDASIVTSDGHAEATLIVTSAGHAEDASMVTSEEQVEDASIATSAGHAEDASIVTSAGQAEDVLIVTSAGHAEDASMVTSEGHADDASLVTPAGYAEDISKIASFEHGEVLSQMTSAELAEDISHITSTGHEHKDTSQPSLKENFNEVTQLASTQVVEDQSQVSLMGREEEDTPYFTRETETFSQMPSGAHVEETFEFFHNEHDDHAHETVSSIVAAETTSNLLKEHDDDYSINSSGRHPEEMPECPSKGHPEDSTMFSSENHVEMSQISSGFITEIPESLPARDHYDTAQFSVDKHVENMDHISSGDVFEDFPQFSLVGHAEAVSHVSVAKNDEDTHISSGQFNEDITHVSSVGDIEEISEISSRGHMEGVSHIPSVEHAEELTMTNDLKDMAQAPSKAYEEDISHVSVTKNIEDVTQSPSPRYLEDLANIPSKENTEVSSQIPSSIPRESLFSEDTSAAFQKNDSISDKDDFADHHIIPEESSQEKFQIQKDLESFECLDVQIDNTDSTRDARYVESKDDDMDTNPSLGDGLKEFGRQYSNDMIVGEDEEEDEADNVMLKEEVEAENESHMLDVSDSELVISDSSCGYTNKHDDEQRDENVEVFATEDHIVTFEDKKGVESGGGEMFIRNPFESHEKQVGQKEERRVQDEHEEDEIEDFGMRDEKGFSSRIDSDIMSSEYEDRSYVDNLSELASPDIIPQPLPSPPEPKDMSSFDPMAPSDTPSPCHEHNGEIGQHGAQFEHAGVVIADHHSAHDFLASVEVEGETKFGVDGSAITSTGENDAFLHSDDDDEDDEGSQNLDQGGFTNTGTTETETSIDDRSGDFNSRGFEQTENNDNALMSMSMEGSFYDDGGDLMGGDDRRNQQQTHLYEDGYITEESSQHDSYEPKPEHFVVNPDEFGQKVLSVLVHEHHQAPQTNSHAMQEKEGDFDPLHDSGVPSGSAVGNGVSVGGHMGDIDALLDVAVIAQSVQLSNTEQGAKFADNVEKQDVAHKSESLGESQRREEHGTIEGITSQGVHISDTAKEKVEKPTASDAILTDKEKTTTTVPDAAAATVASVAGAGAAGGETVGKTATAVKKSSTKPAGKPTTTTTATTTKVSKETKATNGKAATTTTTTTTSKASPKKHAEPRPTSVSTTERKPSSKAAGSPTQSATPPATKPTAPLPSYAQPIPHRKPREAKVLSPEEKKKKAATTATNVTRASSAAPHPRPQSVSSSTATTSARNTARSASTVASRTAQLARPKSSPTKLTNGIASPSTDGVKSPTTKHENDSKKEEHRPRSGRKEHKNTSKVDTGIKSATTPTSVAAKSPTKQASSLTLASPKTGEIKSKIGSLENATHTPGGGHVRIISKKPNYTNVSSKIGSKDNMDYKPGGGNVKIENRKIKVEGKSKVGSLENATHKPGGGDKKIENHKLEWQVDAKIGSLENAKHTPGGGDKKIEVQKTEWKAQSKIGSLDNAKHKPGVGDKQTNGSDGEEKMLKNGLEENTGPVGVSEHRTTELLNGSASEI